MGSNLVVDCHTPFTQDAKTDRPRPGLSRTNNAGGFSMKLSALLILISILLIITRCKDEQDDVPSVW